MKLASILLAKERCMMYTQQQMPVSPITPIRRPYTESIVTPF